MAIIPLHPPNVDDNLIAKATMCSFKGGEIQVWRRNQVWHRNARRKGSGTPENKFAVALLCGFYI